MKKLIPYSVYLPVEYHAKIKELAKNRKASETVRDALKIILDGNDAYKGGFNKAIDDQNLVIDSYISKIDRLEKEIAELKQKIKRRENK